MLINKMVGVIVFFFSSRRRHTRSYGDWSSDVCSSDLPDGAADSAGHLRAGPLARGNPAEGHAGGKLVRHGHPGGRAGAQVLDGEDVDEGVSDLEAGILVAASREGVLADRQ